MGQTGLLVMSKVLCSMLGLVGLLGVSGEAGCRLCGKPKQKPPQSICRHLLMAQWPVGDKGLLGDCLQVAGSIRGSEGLFKPRWWCNPWGSAFHYVAEAKECCLGGGGNHFSNLSFKAYSDSVLSTPWSLSLV